MPILVLHLRKSGPPPGYAPISGSKKGGYRKDGPGGPLYWYPGDSAPRSAPHPDDAHLAAPSIPRQPPKMTRGQAQTARAAVAAGDRPWEKAGDDSALKQAQALARDPKADSAPPPGAAPAPAGPPPKPPTATVHPPPNQPPRPVTGTVPYPSPTAGPRARDAHGRDVTDRLPPRKTPSPTSGGAPSTLSSARDMHGRPVPANLPQHSKEMEEFNQKILDDVRPRSLKEHWKRLKEKLWDDPVVGRDMHGRDLRRSDVDKLLEEREARLPSPPK